MKQWRMRTTLMVSLLAVSLGLTVTCLFIIRVTVQQEIDKSLQADLDHSLGTFRTWLINAIACWAGKRRCLPICPA